MGWGNANMRMTGIVLGEEFSGKYVYTMGIFGKTDIVPREVAYKACLFRRVHTLQ